MSASPTERTPSRTPNGTALPPLRRPKPPADPLVRPKRRQPRPGGPQANPSRPNQLAPNSLPSARAPKNNALAPQPATQIQNPAHHVPTLGLLQATEHVPSGFSSEPVASYTDYPVVMSKRQLMEGLRHHVARFYSKKDIDPRNEEQFTRPVRLHRRDARSFLTQKEGEGEDKEFDEEERERQQMQRAQREAEREAQMAEVAPSANTGGKRLGPSNKKTQQVLQHNMTEEQRARSRLRYEEALQWHLEDFDNKQSWSASYEAALSETYAGLVFKDGKFHMMPMEKWYKFTPRLNIKQMKLEDAEKVMGDRGNDTPDWLVKSQLNDREKKMEALNRRATRKLFVGQAIKDDPEFPAAARQDTGNEELDFEEDRFADDEEPDLFEGDPEDLQAQQERIKQDQYQANVFNMKDEKAYDKADLLEQKAKQAEREHGKRVKKALMKREKKYIYDSDSDENPYTDKSDSTDSEEERQKEDQEKKEAEDKAKESQNASATSTKGNNTPSNRPSKHLDPKSARKPGSANASEASGNESSRKKLKKSTGSKLNTGANTPNGNKSRSRSPAPISQDAAQLQKKPPAVRVGSGTDSLKKRPRGGASGSEGEGAGSGGDMSDGSRKRVKTTAKNPTSARGSPGVSRSPSVEPKARAASPGVYIPVAGQTALTQPTAADPPIPPMPTAAEITAAIPDDGIPMVKLFKMYGGQQPTRKQELIKLLRPLSRYDSQTKMLKKIKSG